MWWAWFPLCVRGSCVKQAGNNNGVDGRHCFSRCSRRHWPSIQSNSVTAERRHVSCSAFVSAAFQSVPFCGCGREKIRLFFQWLHYYADSTLSTSGSGCLSDWKSLFIDLASVHVYISPSLSWPQRGSSTLLEKTALVTEPFDSGSHA